MNTIQPVTAPVAASAPVAVSSQSQAQAIYLQSVIDAASRVSSIVLEFGAVANNAQLNLACAMSLDMKPRLAASAKFKNSEYLRDVVLASGNALCEKSLANAATVSRQLITRYPDKIGAHAVNGFTAPDVVAFAQFIASEANAKGYTLSLADIGYMCKGEQSSRSRKQASIEAALEAEAKAAAEAIAKVEADAQGKIEAEAAQVETLAKAAEQVTQAEAAKKEAEAEAARLKEEAAKQAEELKAAAIKAEAEAERIKAEAETARLAVEDKAAKMRASVAIEVHVNEAGEPVISLAPNQSIDFLQKVADFLLEEIMMQKLALAASMAETAVPVKQGKKGQIRKAA